MKAPKTVAVTFLTALAFCVTLTGFVSDVSGQVLPKRKIEFPKKHFRVDVGDAVYWGGAFADLATSLGQKEGNPVLQNSAGHISMGKGLAMKGGVYAAIKTMEYFYPERPKVTMWFKIAVGGAFGALAFHNSRMK
jgi:hypothetical protein